MPGTELEVKNIASAVGRYTFILPEEGGVTELQGENGAGKSEILEAVEATTSGRGEINKTRGEVEASVSIGGVTAKVRARHTQPEKIDWELIDGRFSVDDFVHPGIDKEDRADARRIAVLASMASADPKVVVACFTRSPAARRRTSRSCPRPTLSRQATTSCASQR